MTVINYRLRLLFSEDGTKNGLIQNHLSTANKSNSNRQNGCEGTEEKCLIIIKFQDAHYSAKFSVEKNNDRLSLKLLPADRNRCLNSIASVCLVMATIAFYFESRDNSSLITS